MIGVIGGNGVAATNKLCQLVEEKLTKKGAFRDAHHPEMLVLQATQVPSRSMYLEGRGPSFIDDYVDIGLKMKNFGCDMLCMCCNTAHYAIKEMEEKIGLPFINIIDEVAKVCQKCGYNQVGVMCSDGCLKTNLYDKSFSKFSPCTTILYPDAEYQLMVTKGICNAKNVKRYLSPENKDNPINLFNNVIENLKKKGANAIIAGCTDIHSVFYPMDHSWYVDSLEVLANKIVEIHLLKTQK